MSWLPAASVRRSGGLNATRTACGRTLTDSIEPGLKRSISRLQGVAEGVHFDSDLLPALEKGVRVFGSPLVFRMVRSGPTCSIERYVERMLEDEEEM